MGAGHPRLSFELEAYTANQPAHYVVDADYEQRKGKIEGMNLWLTGQIENARRMLTLLQTDMFHSGGMFPKLRVLRLPQLPPSDGQDPLECAACRCEASNRALCACRRRT